MNDVCLRALSTCVDRAHIRDTPTVKFELHNSVFLLLSKRRPSS